MKKSQKLLITLFCIPLFTISNFYSVNFTDRFVLPKQFGFIFSTAVLLIAVIAIIIFSKNKPKLSLNKIDIVVILFIVYNVINYYIIIKPEQTNQEIILLVLLYIVYFIFRIIFRDISNNYKNINILLFTVLLFCLAQVFHGLIQLYDFVPNPIAGFKLAGSFGNPGPYTNYLAAIYPIALVIAIFLKPENNFDKVFKILAISAVIGIIIILPPSLARSSWIAIVISTVFILYYKFNLNNKIFNILNTLWKKVIAVIIIILLLVFPLKKLFDYKEDSSKGRLFIWETSLPIIKDNPLFGAGFNSFFVEHNIQQANYFIENPDDIEKSYLADNVQFGFNEYLQITSETGIIGLLLFGLLIYFGLFSNSKAYPNQKYSLLAKASMLAILVCALISYPLHDTTTFLALIFSLAIIATFSEGKIISIQLNRNYYKIILIVLLIPIIGLLKLETKRYSANKKWTEAVTQIKGNNKEHAKRLYRKIYPILKYDRNFLYNYGAEFSILGEYDESLKVLIEAKNMINDADYYTYLGNTYEGLNQLKEAENAFMQASYIIPHKLYPKYRLTYIYAYQNQMDKALELANELVNLKPKVESVTTRNIQREMQQFIEVNSGLNRIE